MRAIFIIAILGVLAGAAWFGWRARSGPSAGDPVGAATDSQPPVTTAQQGDLARTGAPANAPAPVAAAGEQSPVRPATRSPSTPTPAWTGWPTPHTAAATNAPARNASVPPATANKIELAFCALSFVGIDPHAERTWLAAITDRDIPAGVRSDLIEDLNQQGFSDNSRPTKADLELVRARLELIERLAPLATDEVNAAAFAEAYKDLLAMYERLAGGGR